MTLKKMLKLGIIASSIWTIHAITTQHAFSQEANSNTTPVVTNETLSSYTASTVPDTPPISVLSIRPKEIKFNNNAEMENWREEDQPTHDINRASVPLATRTLGSKLINPLANPNAKIHAVSLMNSKAVDHASVGGDEFKAYAFDYWQYVDSLTFWDGPIPSPDVIDTAHRNGVPVYGTLFFNWSSSQEDQDKLLDFIKEDSPNSKTFPLARQLAKMAKYYGFDGYFINQETTGSSLRGKGEQMRQFMLYAKEYAQTLNYPIRFAWYDAMSTRGTRQHVDGVSDANKSFVTANENGTVPADEFFANFNWTDQKNNTSIHTMNAIGRSPFDVYAGFELQARSYHTQIRRSQLIDNNGKLKLSLGLYTPDSVLGLSHKAEDYHKNENIFWTGYNGDPSTSNDDHPVWSGMARYVADKTAINGTTFNTSFNSGHGKKWFIDGKVSRNQEWNYRSVAGILPTWRWWIRSNQEKVTADYDFDNAYNGGNSLLFTGQLSPSTQNDIMLYASQLQLTPTSKLAITHKGGQEANIQIGISTNPNYDDNSFHYFDLTPQNDWTTNTFDLSQFANDKVYAIKLRINNANALPNFTFNLGQLSITEHQNTPGAPQSARILDKRLSHAQLAEGIIQFDKVDQADYYEVYQKYNDEWQLITGSSNNTIYLSQITRPKEATGTTQPLKVVALGKNGVRSTETIVPFDWGMTTLDTTTPRPLAENVVLGATVIGTSEVQQGGSEGIESMLNGTITSNSDKWSSLSSSATVDIRLTQPRTIKRWAMDHAGAGGESVNDGLMNTKDFDLYYKDENGNWQLAHSIRNNIAHVTDVELDHPITAQDWRLHVITSDNGTPWKAIRIYNWRMYESVDSESSNLPISTAHAVGLPNNHVQVSFDNVSEGTTVTLYSDKEAANPIATATATNTGRLVFPVMKDTPLSSLIYYRAQSTGKDISNTLAMPYNKVQKTVKELIYQPIQKIVYKQGEALDLTNGAIQAIYEDGTSETFALTHPAVTISGFSNQQVGKQALSVQFLDQTLSNIQNVFVSDQPMDKRDILDVSLSKKPKTQYYINQPFDKQKGELTITYTDGSSETIALSHQDISIDGYDASQIGTQALTITYAGHKLTLDVTVNKEEVNTQYLEQKLAEIDQLMQSSRFKNATKETQDALINLVEASRQLLDDENKTNQTLNEQVKRLDEAVANLTEQPKTETVLSSSTIKNSKDDPIKTETPEEEPKTNPSSNTLPLTTTTDTTTTIDTTSATTTTTTTQVDTTSSSHSTDSQISHSNDNKQLPYTGTDSTPLTLIGSTIFGLGFITLKHKKKP